MNARSILAILVVVLVAICYMQGVSAIKPQAKMEGVKELNRRNFKTFLKENDKVLIEFYAPWCYYSKEFASEMKKLGKMKLSGVKVAKVNGDKFAGLARKYKVDGFPSVFLIKNGEAVEYKGVQNTAGKVRKFVKKNL